MIAIILYAVFLFVVSLTVAWLSGRSFVPTANVVQPDGQLDFLPAHTLWTFALSSALMIWLSTYRPPPPLIDLFSSGITNMGWIMLGLLLLIRKKSFRVVGFEGRKQVLWGGLGYLAFGTLLTNREALAHLF